MQCRQIFKYQPLDTSKRQRRLVRLISTEESREDPAFSIEHHDIDSAPPFKALSYCWGTHLAATPIEFNGCSMQIYRSLYAFLRMLQKQLEHSYYWIDQLCIDQGNNIEKSQQVAMMSEIYTRAEETVVSLLTGSYADKTLLFMDFMSTAAADMEYNGLGLMVSDRHRSWLNNHSDAVRSFLENSYWNRLWIVQEILLAQSVSVVCTRGLFPFMDLHLIIPQLGLNYPSLCKSIDWFIDEVTLSMGPRPRNKWLGRQFELGYILKTCQGKQCRDVKDNIFALQGIVTPPQRITVDYDLPLEKIVEEVVTVIIRSKSENFKTVEEKAKVCLSIIDDLFPDLRVSFTPQDLLFAKAGDDREERLLRRLNHLFVPRQFSNEGFLLPSS